MKKGVSFNIKNTSGLPTTEILNNITPQPINEVIELINREEFYGGEILSLFDIYKDDKDFKHLLAAILTMPFYFNIPLTKEGDYRVGHLCCDTLDELGIKYEWVHKKSSQIGVTSYRLNNLFYTVNFK